MQNPRNSVLPDGALAGIFGLADLRIGRHSPDVQNLAGERDFWVQSIWRARVLPAFDADAFIAVVTCAKPWQPAANPRPGLWARCQRLLHGRSGLPPPVVTWRKAVLSLQGEPTVTELPHDPVAAALRTLDLFETYEYASLDGICYWFDVETWNVRTCLSFGNPEVPSLQRLAKALLAVGRAVAGSSQSRSAAEYLKVWERYES
jgi:hypothetical protein